MSRWEFMRRLEELLSDISPSEREEALQYYNDYFNDAGKENEKEVMEALGTPEQVAEIVKEGLSENAGAAQFTENGFQRTQTVQNEIVKSEAAKNTVPESSKQKKGMPTWAIVLIVIGCIFLSPFILTLVFSAAAALLGVICAIIGVIAGFGLAALVLFTVAIALIIAGFGCMLPHPVSGIGLIGGGLICAAIGILFMLLTVFLAGKCVPGICQGIAYIWKKLFGKKGGV